MNQPARYEISAHPVDESDRDVTIQHSSVYICTHMAYAQWAYLKIIIVIDCPTKKNKKKAHILISTIMLVQKVLIIIHMYNIYTKQSKGGGCTL